MILIFLGALIQQNDFGKEVEEEGETENEVDEEHMEEDTTVDKQKKRAREANVYYSLQTFVKHLYVFRFT